MTPCHHIAGHASSAHGALCLAIRRAQEHRHAAVAGHDPARILVAAYEAEARGDAAEMMRAARACDALCAAVAGPATTPARRAA